MLTVKDEVIEHYFKQMWHAKAQVNIEHNLTTEKAYLCEKYAAYLNRLIIHTPKKAKPDEIIDVVETFEKIIREKIRR